MHTEPNVLHVSMSHPDTRLLGGLYFHGHRHHWLGMVYSHPTPFHHESTQVRKPHNTFSNFRHGFNACSNTQPNLVRTKSVNHLEFLQHIPIQLCRQSKAVGLIEWSLYHCYDIGRRQIQHLDNGSNRTDSIHETCVTGLRTPVSSEGLCPSHETINLE